MPRPARQRKDTHNEESRVRKRGDFPLSRGSPSLKARAGLGRTPESPDSCLVNRAQTIPPIVQAAAELHTQKNMRWHRFRQKTARKTTPRREALKHMVRLCERDARLRVYTYKTRLILEVGQHVASPAGRLLKGLRVERIAFGSCDASSSAVGKTGKQGAAGSSQKKQRHTKLHTKSSVNTKYLRRRSARDALVHFH